MHEETARPAEVAHTDDVIGEVPHWEAAAGRLWWIDILKPALHRLDTASGEVRSWTPPEKLGSYGRRRDGTMVVGGRGGIALWHPETGRFDRLSEPEADRPDNILNDGRVGPDGRFVIASMNKRLAGPTGRLWQVDGDGTTRCLQDGDIHLPNAICWSPDGATMYLGDSHTNMIWQYDYDRASGAIGNRRLFADTSDLPGDCDGASIDSEGFLWNARFGGACLIRFAPDGRAERLLHLPVSQPTHVTFGGADLATLYVTSGHFRLSDEVKAAEPMSGGLLALPAPCPGLPETPFAEG
ncbi:SMP-30/gluconolactonase/LRE family protein [Aquicoccus sp. SCR17]|nr:SMP-30/gluconolactonase/LRE family protein [Carideicomes alvinocaridis]